MEPTTLSPRRASALDWRIGGALLGALVTIAVAWQGPIGVSTAYVTTEAAIAKQVTPAAAAGNAYWHSIGYALTAEWWLVVGAAVGAFAAALLTRSRATAAAVPETWERRFGASRAARFAGAFAGGFLILFGARLAGGCTKSCKACHDDFRAK